MIPGLPFVKSLKSKVSPNLGFSSIPMYMSYRIEPDVKLAHFLIFFWYRIIHTTEFAVQLMRWAHICLDICNGSKQETPDISSYQQPFPMLSQDSRIQMSRDGESKEETMRNKPSQKSISPVF